MVPNVLVNMQ